LMYAQQYEVAISLIHQSNVSDAITRHDEHGTDHTNTVSNNMNDDSFIDDERDGSTSASRKRAVPPSSALHPSEEGYESS